MGLSSLLMLSNFYPRPPRGGRHVGSGDFGRVKNDFYPRPPRGGRLATTAAEIASVVFLSTPSARRATISHTVWCIAEPISIHALREEGDALTSALSL